LIRFSIWFSLEFFMIGLYAFSQIEVLIDDEFDLILLMGNSIRLGQVMHEMFLDSKESLFGVYFGSGLVTINEYRFGPREVGVQS